MRQLLRLFIPLWLALCLLGCGKPVSSSYPPTMVEAARLSEHEAARALPRAIEWLQAKGYRFGTL